MRRKITEGEQSDDELPELTDQQRKFVEGVLAGKTASDAYRAAYDCSHSGDPTIWVNASRLRADANVALWLSAARKAGLSRAVVTLEGHIGELERLREIALESGNVGAAVQAEQLRGKASGHYTEQFRDMTMDVSETLREIARSSPELAAQLAKDNGIEWQGETQH